MKKLKLYSKYAAIYTAIGVVVLFLASLYLAYKSDLRDPLTVGLKRIYPIAFIDGRVISVNDLEQGKLIGQKFGLSAEQAKNRHMENEKAYALARKLNISITADAEADEARFYTKGNESDYQELLRKYFNRSESLFYKYVINPQIIDSGLRMKYYSDSTNSAGYKKAQAALARISKGEKFEDIAKAESDDKISGQLGGDMGFYESGQILPELEDQVSVSALGEVRKDVIITRLGYHLIYPVEHSIVDGKKVWHAKHILYSHPGYEEWLVAQKQNIEVKYVRQ